MKKLKIPCVWPEPAPDIVRRTLGVEAEKLFHCYTLTGDAEEWKKQRSALHEKFARAMNLHADHSLPLDYREYGEVRCDGYAVRRVTYTAAPGRTVTGNLYVPDGKGPFPAVIRTHGHWKDGRLAAGVQRCCHFLVRTGFVVRPTACVPHLVPYTSRLLHGALLPPKSWCPGPLQNLGSC